MVISIREATVSYKAEANALQKRLQRLQFQLESLDVQTSSLIQGHRARTAAAAGAVGNLQVVQEKLACRNLEVGSCNGTMIHRGFHCKFITNPGRENIFCLRGTYC